MLSEDQKHHLRNLYKGKSYEELYGIEEAKRLKEVRRLAKIGNKYFLGKTPWNKGLTKADPRVANGINIRENKRKEKQHALGQC